MQKEKDCCRVCGRKEGQHAEFRYPVGYYEFELSLGGRATPYMICSRCNRCFTKGSTHDLENPRPRKTTEGRIIYSAKGTD